MTGCADEDTRGGEGLETECTAKSDADDAANDDDEDDDDEDEDDEDNDAAAEDDNELSTAIGDANDHGTGSSVRSLLHLLAATTSF